jgi:hypothetical protein
MRDWMKLGWMRSRCHFAPYRQLNLLEKVCSASQPDVEVVTLVLRNEHDQPAAEALAYRLKHYVGHFIDILLRWTTRP